MSAEEHVAEAAPGPKIEFKPEKFQLEVQRPVARFEITDWEAKAIIANHVRSILPDMDPRSVLTVAVDPKTDNPFQSFHGFDVVVTLKEGA